MEEKLPPLDGDLAFRKDRFLRPPDSMMVVIHCSLASTIRLEVQNRRGRQQNDRQQEAVVMLCVLMSFD